MTEDPVIYRTLGPIYISSIQPLLNGEDLYKNYKIKTIISVTKTKIPSNYTLGPYQHFQIPIDDLPTEIIIPYFPQVNKLISQTIYKPIENINTDINSKKKLELSGSAVLIHCQSGISRSTAFVCAYLMNKYNLTLEHSLHAIRRNNLNHSFQPNDGFIEQLEIYKENDWCVDLIKLRKNSPRWRAYRMEFLMSDLRNKNQFTDIEINENSNNSKNIKDENWFGFKCAKCRTLLASSEVYIPHAPPFDKDDKQLYFVKNAFKSKRVVNIQKGQNECTKIFTEPLTWMQEKLVNNNNNDDDDNDNDDNEVYENLEGRLDCYKCGSKIGGWNWKGDRCSCGKWMVPAIYLFKSKIIQVDANNKLILLSDNRSV